MDLDVIGNNGKSAYDKIIWQKRILYVKLNVCQY